MSPDAVIGAGALWVAIPLAVLAGLVSFASPCVLPLLPGYLGFLTGTVTPRRTAAVAARVLASVPEPVQGPPPAVPRARLVGATLLFVAGFTVVFVVAVIIGGALGSALIAYQDVITRILGVAVIVLGLAFTGVFGPLQRTLRIGLRGDLGLVGAPLLGIALGIGWTPCIGPTLAAIIAVSYNLGDPGRAVLLGLGYSAGLGIPFVLIALGLGWASRSVAFVRRHLRTVNIVGGAILVAVGLLMLTGLWTALLSVVQGWVLNVPLPL